MRPSSLFLRAAILLMALPVGSRASWSDPMAGRPVMQVFGPSDYGTTAENWCVVRDRKGRLFVGNDGIHVFDGRTWSHIKIGTVPLVRSLELDDDDRIWVAADGDFGYLEEHPSGSFQFISLRKSAPVNTPTAGWGVFRQGNCTVFVMSDSLVVWDGKDWQEHPLPNQNRLFSFRFRGGIAISQDETLWLWRDRRLEKLDIPGVRQAAWGFQCRDGTELMYAQGGICRVSPEGPAWIPLEKTEALRRGLVTAAIRIGDNLICVATLTGGLFFLDDSGSIVRRLDRNAGLPSQACFGAFLDHEDGLWVATSRAVFRLDARGLSSRFDAGNGLGGGSVKVLTSTPGSMIALDGESACRLVSLADRSPVFSPLPDQSTAFIDALHVGGDRLLLGGLRYLVSIREEVQEAVLLMPSTVFRMARFPLSADTVFAGAGARIFEIDASAGSLRQSRVVGETQNGARDLSFDAEGVLWVAQYSGGLLSVFPDVSEAGTRSLEPSDAPPASLADPRLFSLNGTVYAYNSDEIWRLPRRGEPGPRRELAGLGLHAAERIGTSDIWAIARRDADTRLVRLAAAPDGPLTATVVECPGLETLGGVLCAARDHEGRALWLGGYNGALRLDLTAPRVEPPPPAPSILRVERRVGDEPGSLLPLAGGVSVDFDGAAALAFDVRDAADVLGSPARLEERLVGRDTTWSAGGALRTYTGLREGSYELQVRAVDLLGRTSPTTSYSLTVLPPWFRTAWAYAGYVLGGLAVVGGSAQLWALRVKRRNLLLERIVKQRTEELQRAMTARTAFLANMGHEIRNPLNGVVGLIEMLRASGDDAEQRRQTVHRLGTCADQLVSVVEDVLEFSKVDAGQISVRPQPFFVRQPLEATVDIFRAAEPGRTLAIEASEADLGERVVGDPVRIRQVLVNYVANALKFAPTGPVTLGVEKRGDGFVFSVADQGPGISRDQQARLFMRFSRGSFAHREGIPGSGLGLAACRAYAEAMGGEVWVESEPGQGATFLLLLPLRRAIEGDLIPTTLVPDIMAGRTALVVDDHEFNRIVLSDLLGRMGAVPTAVPDVPGAQAAFSSHLPDVVFVDFDLAGGATGADLARWIRHEAPAGRDVPIVATSAFEVEEIRQRCAEAGMDGFIAKPVTTHKVAEIMSRIEAIRTGGVGQEIPAAPTMAPAPGAGFLDLLSDGDPARRRELERTAWREVRTEASSALRQARKGNLTETGRHAHRLTSAAVMLGLTEVVTVSRQLTGAARAADAAGTDDAADALRKALIAAKRQLRDGG